MALILMFALPLMLGNVFQQLYTLVDTMVVGRFVGVEALASLGAADWLNWLVLGIPTGFAQGFSILMSQNFGAGEQDELRRSVAMSIVLSAIIAAATLAVSQIFLVPTLKLLNTPENVLPGLDTLFEDILQRHTDKPWPTTCCRVCCARWATAHAAKGDDSRGDNQTLCWICCSRWRLAGALRAWR